MIDGGSEKLRPHGHRESCCGAVNRSPSRRGRGYAQARRQILLLMVAAISVLFSPYAHCQKAPFSLKISAPERSKAGTPIRVDIELTNTSDHEILILMSKEEARAELGSFEVEVFDPRGNEGVRTKYGNILRKRYPFLSHSRKGEYLKPGEVMKDALILTQLYDLAPGTYTVQLTREDRESKQVVRSNKVKLTVTE